MWLITVLQEVLTKRKPKASDDVRELAITGTLSSDGVQW